MVSSTSYNLLKDSRLGSQKYTVGCGHGQVRMYTAGSATCSRGRRGTALLPVLLRCLTHADARAVVLSMQQRADVELTAAAACVQQRRNSRVGGHAALSARAATAHGGS